MRSNTFLKFLRTNILVIILIFSSLSARENDDDVKIDRMPWGLIGTLQSIVTSDNENSPYLAGMRANYLFAGIFLILGLGIELQLTDDAINIPNSNKTGLKGIFCVLCTAQYSVSYISTNHWRMTVNLFSSRTNRDFINNLGFSISLDVPSVKENKFQISFGIAHHIL